MKVINPIEDNFSNILLKIGNKEIGQLFWISCLSFFLCKSIILDFFQISGNWDDLIELWNKISKYFTKNLSHIFINQMIDISSCPLDMWMFKDPINLRISSLL